jgi:26S proteasome regulatory subunit T4
MISVQIELLINSLVREDMHKTEKEYNKSEDDLKALQSAGQILGEVLRQLDEDRCM